MVRSQGFDEVRSAESLRAKPGGNPDKECRERKWRLCPAKREARRRKNAKRSFKRFERKRAASGKAAGKAVTQAKKWLFDGL